MTHTEFKHSCSHILNIYIDTSDECLHKDRLNASEGNWHFMRISQQILNAPRVPSHHPCTNFGAIVLEAQWLSQHLNQGSLLYRKLKDTFVHVKAASACLDVSASNLPLVTTQFIAEQRAINPALPPTAPQFCILFFLSAPNEIGSAGCLWLRCERTLNSAQVCGTVPSSRL
jgi:hypothetical protein